MKNIKYFLDNEKLQLKIVVLLFIILFLVVSIFEYNNGSVKHVTEKISTVFHKNQTSDLDFYEKIKNKKNINILVIGDSIGESDGVNSEQAWYTKLSRWFDSEYNIKANVKLLTHPGGGILNGLSEYSKNIASGYDLIIVCYGQNDRQWILTHGQYCMKP